MPDVHVMIRSRRLPMSTISRPALIVCALLAGTAAAQFPVIELNVISPSIGQLGTTLPLRVSGGNQLDQIDRLLFSDPRITAEVLSEEPLGDDAAADEKRTPKWGHFLVSIPADLTPGRYEVRAAGAYGISNPRVFRVSASPVITLDAVSQEASEPTSLDDHLKSSGSLVVNHQATAARIDYYRLSGLAKQPRRISLDAQRIDSRMIGQLKLIGSDGRSLQTARGADGFDPSVTIPAGQTGDVTLAVHDFLFRGGEHYFYGLRITDEVGTDHPATSLSGTVGLLPAWDALEAISVVDLATHDPTDAISIASERSSAGVVHVSPPCIVEARFDASHNDHVFHFTAEQGQRLSIEILSQRMGQPTDPRLIIERQESKTDGAEIWHAVANEDDPPVIGDAAMRLRSKDPIIQFTAPSAATYRVKARNLDTGRSLADEPIYRLVIREPSPDFQLVAMLAHPHNDLAQARPRGCQLMRGDTQSIRVLAIRRDGFGGPIELSAEGLPDGLTCRPVRIAANQSEAHLSVLASDDAANWIGDVQIIGKAVEDDELSRNAAAATFIWGSGDQRDFIRSRLATKLVMSVTQQQQTPLSIRLGSEQPASSKPGTNVSLPITLIRRDGAADPVTLRPRNLPPGVTVGEVTVAGDQSEGTIEVKIAAEAKPGIYSIWLLGETKVKFKPMTQTDSRDLTVFISSNTANIELTDSP